MDVKNVDEWLIENESFFVPPVCNKCMYADQLKVFFVGGPNQRRDYHLEEGEEVFYQLKGNMCLKVVEKGVKKNIIIREGELFVLPARVEHSPQRYADTIGMVVERTRANTEFDCVRYFLGESFNRQFERWFHLQDVVVDLPPLIGAFLASKSQATNSVTDESFLVNAPYEPKNIDLDSPLNLSKFCEDLGAEVEEATLFGPPKYRSSVKVHKEGEHKMESGPREEIILWIINIGRAIVNAGDKDLILLAGHIMRIPPRTRFTVQVEVNWLLSIRMPA